MATERIIPGEIRIFLNHIYEFKKGVRNMVLYTMSKEHEEFAIRRLKNQKISYMIQEVGTNKINLFFGKAEECERIESQQTGSCRAFWRNADLGQFLYYCKRCGGHGSDLSAAGHPLFVGQPDPYGGVLEADAAYG